MSTLLSTDMILERSSTRLHAPPGGKSSICFGSYEPEEPVVRKRQPVPTNNVFAHVEPENIRNAPREIQGASHNNIFGGEVPSKPTMMQQAAPQQTSNNIFQAPEPTQVMRQAPVNNIFTEQQDTAPMVDTRADYGGSVSDPNFQAATPTHRYAQQDNIFNLEANAAADAMQNTRVRAQAAQQRSSDIFGSMSQEGQGPRTRARQAPGGTSSIVLG